MQKFDHPLSDKIILGTVQFGLDYGINNSAGKPDRAAIKAILDFAFLNSIKFLDTAEGYGDSHEAIGNYHRQSANKFKVITKYSAGRTDLSENLTERVLQDLKVLNVEALYGYMFHSFNDFQKYNGIYKNEIESLKSQGIIQKFGVSVYTNTEIEEVLKYEGIELIQFPYNLLDNASQRAAVIRTAKKKGIEIHTRSSFLQGLFFKNTDQLPGQLTALKPYLQEINGISKDRNINLTELALNYVVQQENIDRVLIGVDSVEQLKANLQALGKQISPEAIQQIDRIDVKEVSLLNPSNWN